MVGKTGLAVAVVVVGTVTACGSSGSSFTPVTQTFAPPSINPRLAAVCQQLAANWQASDTAADSSISRQMAGTRAGADFSKMIQAVRSGDAAAASADGKTMSSDCAAAG
jgi:ABC-type glycerol-3-phosphate transport system substrate-binding protein